MKTDTSPCFHCAEPCPPDNELQIRYRNAEHAVCCAGCKAVAETIISSGLDQYYAQREKPADRKDPLPTELREQLSLYDDTQLQADFVNQTGE
ncbi:MAG: heavy metal translocating P-type ATPase metal-binding domain-containing protein, partial [Deefgea sp.]